MHNSRPTDEVATGEIMSEELQEITELEKREINSAIGQHAYLRRPAGFHFRDGYGIHDYCFRVVGCIIFWAFAYFEKVGSP